MKQVLLKTIAIVVAKLIRSRVLQVGWGGVGFHRAPMSGDKARKFFLKTKPYAAGVKTPSFGPAPLHCHLY